MSKAAAMLANSPLKAPDFDVAAARAAMRHLFGTAVAKVDSRLSGAADKLESFAERTAQKVQETVTKAQALLPAPPSAVPCRSLAPSPAPAPAPEPEPEPLQPAQPSPAASVGTVSLCWGRRGGRVCSSQDRGKGMPGSHNATTSTNKPHNQTTTAGLHGA